MGAGGPYPNPSYSDNYGEFNFSYSNQPIHPLPPNPIPPYIHPPIYPGSFPRAYPPINNFGPGVNGFHFHHGMHPNPMIGPGLYTLPRPPLIGSFPPMPPPPIPPNGNIQLNRPGEYRFNEHRPQYYDEQ